MKLEYVRKGDYLYPNLTIESTESRPIGIWGIRRKEYLKEHRIGLYTELLFTGTLDSHLADIDEQAEAMFERLTIELAKSDDITEQFKEENSLLWVAEMNAVRLCAVEIVNNKLIQV